MRRNGTPLWAFWTLTILVLAACAAAGPAPTGAPVAVPATEAPGNEPGENENPGAPVAPDQQLIVYTGSLELDVADLDAAVQQAGELIRGLGGHVASSHAEDAGDFQFATVTYRVPATNWEEALAGVRALAERVVNETTESEDVTAQVVDLDARLANLRVTETALQSIMDRATTIDDVLTVQRELTRVREEIETLTAQRDHLANRAAMATLTVTFGVPVAEISLASEGWNLGSEIERAVASLVRVGQAVASLLIWLLIVVLPVVVPIGVAVFLAIRIRRWWLASHPTDREMRLRPPGASSV